MKKFVSIVLAVTVLAGVSSYAQTPVNHKDTQEVYAASPSEIMPMSTGIDISYVSKDESKYDLALIHPKFYTTPYASACACIAGSNVLGYYDRYDENLIPNHSSGYELMGSYVYNMQDSSVTEVVRQLYADMGTSINGTSVESFKKGMEAYCKRLGKNITFISCMSNNRFDYSKAKIYAEYNQPVVLFMSGYNVASLSTSNGLDKLTYTESNENHTMVSFGYRELTYTQSKGTVTYQLLTVAACLAAKPNGYFDVNYNTKINEALAIRIY